jgi:hypothetical protein
MGFIELITHLRQFRWLGNGAGMIKYQGTFFLGGQAAVAF